MMKSGLFSCLLLLFITSCLSPDDSFIKGKYEQAYSLALKECQRGKCSSTNRTILERSLAALLEEGKIELAKYEQSEDAEDWEFAISRTIDFQIMLNECRSYVDPVFLTQVELLLDWEMLFRQRATTFYKKQGMEQLAFAVENESTYAAVAAVENFNIANYYALEPFDIDSLVNETVINGTITTMVKTELAASFSKGLEIDQKFKEVEEYSHYFHKIVYDQEGTFDCTINIRFDSLTINFQETRDSQSFSEKIALRNEDEPDYKNINATVITLLDLKVVQVRVKVTVEKGSDKCSYSGETYFAEIDSETTDYLIEGDDSIVPDYYKDFIAKPHPSDEEMLKDLLDDIYEQFVSDYFGD